VQPRSLVCGIGCSRNDSAASWDPYVDSLASGPWAVYRAEGLRDEAFVRPSVLNFRRCEKRFVVADGCVDRKDSDTRTLSEHIPLDWGRILMKPMYLTLAMAVAWTAAGLKAQTAAAASAAPSPAQTTAAVQLVAKTYAPNPVAKVEGSKTGLPKNGSWGARAAMAAERTGACDETGAVCVAVLYRVGAPEIVCRWTVLFAPGDNVGRVLRQSDAAATYMLRAFPVGDADAPLLESRRPPDSPPSDKYAQRFGVVSVRLYVDLSGAVKGIFIMANPNPGLNRYVIHSLSQWKFRPAILDDQPVWAQVDVDVKFGFGNRAFVTIKSAK
jgi:hypothetical protein